MIDTDKYEGHTPAPWEWPEEDSILLKATLIIDTYKSERYIITERHLSGDSIDRKADAALIADAPLLLAEVKRLRHRLMLAESALGEVRAYDEGGEGSLGEILEHYRDKEGVEMPNVFDEVIE